MLRSHVLLGLVALCVAMTAAACGSSGSITSTARRAQPPGAANDELPSSMDNGAKGRGVTFDQVTHVPPTKACGDRLHGSKASLVIRMLPDGPRAPDGSLAFTSGVCVYLPPGYAQSSLRYPVIYLLHGSGGDAGSAVSEGRLQETMDDLIARDPRAAAIVVMPDGDDAQWYDSVDGSIKNETYIASYVVPFVDRHLRTIPNRKGRAITGVSNGGFGAMLLAAKHPDLFVAAGGMSSNLDWLGGRGLGDPVGPYYHENHPLELADRLALTGVILDISNRCTSTDPADQCATVQLDQLFLPSNQIFARTLAAAPGRRAAIDFREDDGSHQWRTWTALLRTRQLPFFLAPRRAEAVIRR